MGVFDLNAQGSGNYWNYSGSDKPNYMTSITGTVVEVIRKQGTDYATKQPKVWKDGSPRAVFQLMVKGASGRELGWVFEMFTKNRETGQRVLTKPAQAIADALDPNGGGTPSLEDLLGLNVTISTEEGVYNQTHPRPFHMVINGPGDMESVRGATDLLAAQAQPQPQPQPSAYQQAPTALQQQVQAAGQALGYEQDELYGEDIPF